MALGGKLNWLKVKKRVEGGSGCVRYTRNGLGRKRILISNVDEDGGDFVDSNGSPLKRNCTSSSMEDFEFFPLEALPQELVIRIISGVNHEDLKQLFHVSKSIREATQIAKEDHFAFTTPKKTKAFQNSIDLQESEFETEAPNAPKQIRIPKSRLNRDKFPGISVALFASPKKGLFHDE